MIKNMLSVERVKELINDPSLSDKEIEEIRDGFYQLSEIMFEQWQAERIKAKAEQKDNEKKEVQGLVHQLKKVNEYKVLTK